MQFIFSHMGTIYLFMFFHSCIGTLWFTRTTIRLTALAIIALWTRTTGTFPLSFHSGTTILTRRAACTCCRTWSLLRSFTYRCSYICSFFLYIQNFLLQDYSRTVYTYYHSPRLYNPTLRWLSMYRHVSTNKYLFLFVFIQQNTVRNLSHYLCHILLHSKAYTLYTYFYCETFGNP